MPLRPRYPLRHTHASDRKRRAGRYRSARALQVIVCFVEIQAVGCSLVLDIVLFAVDLDDGSERRAAVAVIGSKHERSSAKQFGPEFAQRVAEIHRCLHPLPRSAVVTASSGSSSPGVKNDARIGILCSLQIAMICVMSGEICSS